MMGGYGATLDQETAVPEESLPDDVPLTRTQLQAKVSYHCPDMLPR